jgi:GNAT superfamily N-acetyltransferase
MTGSRLLPALPDVPPSINCAQPVGGPLICFGHKATNMGSSVPPNVFVSTDKAKLDTRMVFSFLTNSYWAQGRTWEEVKKTIANSLCFGVYQNEEQIGFARVITDEVTFAYLLDLFVLEAHRGRGVASMLVRSILEHPALGPVTWVLATSDAHSLYGKFGFSTVKGSRFMRREPVQCISELK